MIERAIWIIERLSAAVLQMRQDLETLRKQKKELHKDSDKLKVKV